MVGPQAALLAQRAGAARAASDREHHDASAWTPVVLACAHLNHDPSDSAPHQLAALCQRCHMLHDGPEHRRRRWMNAHYRRALGDLFYGPYPPLGADWITPTPISMLDDSRSLYAHGR
jgi:hypothetical protein